MGNFKRLRTGDPCPCCGQPIRTTDPQLLELLTRIAADPLFRAAVCSVLVNPDDDRTDQIK